MDSRRAVLASSDMPGPTPKGLATSASPAGPKGETGIPSPAEILRLS